MEFDFVVSCNMRNPTHVFLFRGINLPFSPRKAFFKPSIPPLPTSQRRHHVSFSLSPVSENIQSSSVLDHTNGGAILMTEFEDTTFSGNASKLSENKERIVVQTREVRRGLVGFGRRYVDGKSLMIRYSELLKLCASGKDLWGGMAIHGQLVVTGLEPDTHLWISLLNLYAKCGTPECALRLFDEMPNRDVVSWTALISGFVAQGCGSEGAELFCEMRKGGVMPNKFTLPTVLKACSLCLELEMGKQVHGEVIKTGVDSDLFVGSALVDLYAKCGELESAERLFFSMPQKNAVSWNSLLNGYAQSGCGTQVLGLFSQMAESDIKFSAFTLSTFLKGCANSENLRGGQAVHSMAMKMDCDMDEFISCSLVDMYSKCGMADDALKLFTGIEHPDTVTWSAIITCLEQQGKTQEALELFSLMRQNGAKPNEYTLASLVSASIDYGDQLYGESLHAFIYKYGYESHNCVGNALVSMYMKCGDVQSGSRAFELMTDRDLVTWNALLSGYHDEDVCDAGPQIFSEVLAGGLIPNMYTFISILRSCSSLSDTSFGKQVHAHIVKNKMNENDFVGTALIDMYAKSNSLEDAEFVFHRLNRKDIFSWTVIIAACVRSDQAEKAVKYFKSMQRDGMKPNEFTFASCLSACSDIAFVETGQQVHSMAIKIGHSDDLFVAGALVDMYGKCGCIDEAVAVFDCQFMRDTILWNTIICGYSQHGQEMKALEAFQLMLTGNVVPDEVTFLGVLSACSRMGLVEEGQRLFKELGTTYRISPTIEHYACMVDILGRAGRFNEVIHFIEEEKMNSSSIIWETVLGACHLHGNLELGKLAAENLFQLVPSMESTYILLSNIYASRGRWDDVRDLRVLMSSQGIKKEPGCSWVEVEGRVHVFLSQDASHPRIQEIYSNLEETSKKLTASGYIPKIKHVLHDVTDNEKKENLMYHSERLALSFSLIGAKPQKTIRIFKNLRICGDCHEFMKHFSSLLSKKIIVRDVKQFHHFKDGTCSCGDYW
uniref:DYW domain-containing protein n=1 Tax=Kalanchoe fedtschenkoi TaxID=63787 RepID=A0A7N1A2T3_KALFE